MPLRIIEATFPEIIQLRKQILRPNDIDDKKCYYSEDKDPLAIHLFLKLHNQNIGIASILPEANILKNGEFALWRLRGVGILPEHQNHGHGKFFLQHITDIIYMNEFLPCWISARSYLVPLYQKYGAEIISTPYNIEGTGEHIDLYLNYK